MNKKIPLVISAEAYNKLWNLLEISVRKILFEKYLLIFSADDWNTLRNQEINELNSPYNINSSSGLWKYGWNSFKIIEDSDWQNAIRYADQQYPDEVLVCCATLGELLTANKIIGIDSIFSVQGFYEKYKQTL